MKAEGSSRAIIHLDADAFFVSCEMASNPSLLGKPVAVGGSRRGIIASASYEARQMGVFTPMPTSQAVRICPPLIVLPGDYEKYEHFSRRLFSLLNEYTPIVEVGSIDEGYGDFSGIRNETPRSAALRLREDIRARLGISVSIGLGTSKLVASIASKLNKPDHFLEIPPGTEREFLSPLGVKWLPGVGEKMENTLHAAGVHTISDVASSSLESLVLICGSSAAKLREFALGVDHREVVVDAPPAQSYGRQETFADDTVSPELVRRTLRVMADSLMGRVRADGKMVRGVEVRIRHPDMSQTRRSTTLSEPTDLETDVYGLMDALLGKVWDGRRPVRLVGLKLSQVYDSDPSEQPDLALPGFSRQSRRTLASLMDRLNERYGDGTVVRAHRL